MSEQSEQSEQSEYAEGRTERRAALHHLTKTDPDPRVRRRAPALLLVDAGYSPASAARLLQTSASRVHVWGERFAAEGRVGLVDRPRGGRPHALSDADRALLGAMPTGRCSRRRSSGDHRRMTCP